MNDLIKSTSKEAYDFFCEHISRRKTEKICEQNKNESKENDL